MDKERFEELCSLYFLNDISQDELNELKAAFKRGDEEVQKIFNAMEEIYLQLPLAAEQINPPASIKEKLFSEIKGSDLNLSVKENSIKESLSSKIARFLGLNNPAFALTVCVILLLAAVWLGYYSINLLKSIDTQQKQITELKTELEKNREMLAVLGGKRIEVVTMDGLKVNPAGYGKIIWDPNKKSAILQISNLPAVQNDKDYQLWVIKNNKPISAGIFDVTRNKRENFYKINNLAETNIKDINAFAVTLEPKGGVPQPTGDMYLLGKPVSNL